VYGQVCNLKPDVITQSSWFQNKVEFCKTWRKTKMITLVWNLWRRSKFLMTPIFIGLDSQMRIRHLAFLLVNMLCSLQSWKPKMLQTVSLFKESIHQSVLLVILVVLTSWSRFIDQIFIQNSQREAWWAKKLTEWRLDISYWWRDLRVALSMRAKETL